MHILKTPVSTDIIGIIGIKFIYICLFLLLKGKNGDDNRPSDRPTNQPPSQPITHLSNGYTGISHRELATLVKFTTVF